MGKAKRLKGQANAYAKAQARLQADWASALIVNSAIDRARETTAKLERKNAGMALVGETKATSVPVRRLSSGARASTLLLAIAAGAMMVNMPGKGDEP